MLEYTGEGTEQFVDAEGVQLDHHPDPSKSRGQYLPLLELAAVSYTHLDVYKRQILATHSGILTPVQSTSALALTSPHTRR